LPPSPRRNVRRRLVHQDPADARLLELSIELDAERARERIADVEYGRSFGEIRRGVLGAGRLGAGCERRLHIGRCDLEWRGRRRRGGRRRWRRTSGPPGTVRLESLAASKRARGSRAPRARTPFPSQRRTRTRRAPSRTARGVPSDAYVAVLASGLSDDLVS